jgi:hypothetical protein
VPRFHQGVIVIMVLATHARGHAVLLKPFRVFRRGVWAAAIRVREHASRWPVVGDRAGSSSDHENWRPASIYCPPPMVRRDQVLQARSSKPSVLRSDIRDIRHPYRVRAISVTVWFKTFSCTGNACRELVVAGSFRATRDRRGWLGIHRATVFGLRRSPSRCHPAVIWGRPSRVLEAVTTARICSTRRARGGVPGHSATDGTSSQNRFAS